MSKTIKKLGILVAILILFMGINTISNAITTNTSVDVIKRFTGTMPQRSTAGKTGMFPQYYLNSPGRQVTLDDARLSYATNQWKATATGPIVYCADYGAYVRYGKYDPDIHYLYPGNITIQGISVRVSGNDQDLRLKNILDKKVRTTGLGYFQSHIANNYEYYPDRNSSHKSNSSGTVKLKDYEYHIDGDINAIGYALLANSGAEMEQLKPNIKVFAEYTMQNFFEALGESLWPGHYETSIDNKNYTTPTITATDGPEVVVMEQSQNQSNGYKETKIENYTNNKKAFIFSSADEAYTTNPSTKYTLNDLQTAYWKILEEEGGETPSSKKSTVAGLEIYQKSLKYDEFLKETVNGYNVNLNDLDAQVIADRKNQRYIVGPFSVSYPDYQDISYIKSLVVTAEGNTLVYDESHQDFDIVLYGEGTSSSGQTKKYPKAGQEFFIIVSANKIDYAKDLNLKANCEYISNTNASTKMLTAQANIYRYYGYTQFVGTRAMIAGVATATYQYTVADREVKHYRTVTKYDPVTGASSTHRVYDHSTYENKTVTQKLTYQLYQPYIKMDETPVAADAQELLAVETAERQYSVKSADADIDLTMKLGGIVWEDSEGGKESISDGKMDISKDTPENKIPNVIVTLYKEDGTPIGVTKTDNNGQYRFSRLNSMYQYYVKFTYNGQYYQPTTYSSSSTWGEVDYKKDDKGKYILDSNGQKIPTIKHWKTNSNATDKKNERLEYNMKFEKIASAPTNYNGSAGYNETFTKRELLGYTLNANGEYEKTRQAVIDDYGNLILETSNDALTLKMIQYVKDCRIDAYTGNGNGGYDLYPVPSLFLIDDGYKWRNTPTLLGSNGISGISILYDNAYYINLGLNPRQESDLAIKKDVDKVTLEINGQEHIYTYDTLENKENAENTWDINLRLSDVVSGQKYYNTNYSREIYTSDYLYKASNYGNEEKQKELGKAKADELEVYVTYKIMVRNQAMSIQSRVDEIVDYYDKDLEYMEARSYIQIGRGANAEKYAVQANLTTSRYETISKDTITTIDGYDTLYIRGLSEGAQSIDAEGKASGSPLADGIYLEGGQTAYVYLTFKVKKVNKDGEDWVRLDEAVENAEEKIGVGKENIVELNGYTTRYAQGTTVPNVGDVSYKPAGIVDRDSKPGNLNAADVPKGGIRTNKTRKLRR